MNKVKKIMSLAVVCISMLTLSPTGVLNKRVSAEENIPKYLNYDEGEMYYNYLYKDKLATQITQTFNDNTSKSEVCYFDNGVKKNLDGNIGIRMNYKEFEYSTNEGNEKNEYYIFDMEQGKVSGINKDFEKEKIISEKYGNKYKIGISSYATSKNYGGWGYYSTIGSEDYKKGIITPDDKVVEYEDNTQWYNDTVDGDNYYVILFKVADPSNSDVYLEKINKDGSVKKYELDAQTKENYGVVNVRISNNKIYLQLYNKKDKADNFYYKMNVNGNMLTKGEKLFNILDDKFTQDYYNNFWRVEGGFVYKLENNEWVKKYQVDSNMNDVYVYDDNNLLVTGFIEGKEQSGSDHKYIYKIINNKTNPYVINIPTEPEEPTTPSTPSVPTTGNGQENGGTTNNGNTGSNSNNSSNGSTNGNTSGSNGQSTSVPNNGATIITPEKVVVSPVKDGVLPIAVNKLDKDAANLVEAVTTSNANKVEVTIADTKAIKEGTGSLQVKVGQNSLLSLPFSVVDKTLLTDTAKLVLSTSAESNTDLVRGLKAVKKLYSFDLTVIDGDKKTPVHNFANGAAEITLTLTDEDLKDLDKNNLAVFYYNEETKKFELMETKIDGNKITFKTPHFSKFIIAEKSKSATEVLPKTGSSFGTTTIVTLGSMLVLVGFIFFKRKKIVNVNS
ncbi:LPXTG cell wall anchor domain-containing protein [Clostridium folliculivorans]|uniref:LPXTG cell wall anchor domain-containing protein n=1 Tax=Clostridium folliculivorans TaxID=2886038 RepID=UPI0021C3AA24|nr:LPXTG cell wall anchor domain-containing protein [Clostridium folliculivorans]GKU31634.1 hypothetical protein CFB3_37410 [Clostridium folliculivorans]